MFYNTKRYNALNLYWRQLFGKRVERIALDIGMGCPHRLNGRGQGGCIFCYSGGNYYENLIDTTNLSNYIKNFIQRRTIKKDKYFIAYFQSYSATYGDLTKLKTAIEIALQEPKIVGISISTRPDCFNNEVFDLLENVNKRTHLWVEMGQQTAILNSLKFLRRGHGVQEFIDNTHILKSMNIKVLIHIILGLPNENYSDIDKTIELVNNNNVDGIKFHQLHILNNTDLANLYYSNKIKPISLLYYINQLEYFIERIKPNIIVHRLLADAPEELIIAPLWMKNKGKALNIIEKHFEHKNIMQGKLYKLIYY